MVTRIKAAVQVHKPPLMFILGDYTHTEWTRWDIALVNALYQYEEMSTGGVPLWWDRSDNVRFTVESYTSKSKAAMDRAEEKASKGKNKNYGKVFYPVAHPIEGDMLPTLEDYLEEQRIKREMSSGKVITAGGAIDPFDNSGWIPPEGP